MSGPTPSSTGEHRDYRVVVGCVVLALVAIAAGIAAVVVDEVVFALVAAVVGVLAAGVGAILDLRRSQAETSMWEARAQARRLRRELARLSAVAAEERSIAAARSPDELPGGAATDDWEIDPASGLIRERHLPVVLQQVVASARRKVQPVSVIYWELDGFHQALEPALDDAITALGAVAWRTLRESDAVFRLGDRVALGVLADTSEDGAVVVADRVRSSLRTSAVGDTLTVSAGIACYPTHALDAAELVSCAGRALDDSRAAGFTENHVAVAPDA